AKAYHEALLSLKEELGLTGDVDLATLAGFRDVISSSTLEHDDEMVWEFTGPAVVAALEALVGMREQEGEALAADLTQRFNQLFESLGQIEELAPGRAAAYGERLKARVEEMFDGITLDEDRLHHEIAIFADRIDISEEGTRLKSHLDQVRTLMEGAAPAGRQLNFLLQEMHREVNTLGSKANDQEISHLVVGMKEELEKIREQVQNIE
ncbi:YicC family protein, partial [Gemmatimonadota bacterium]